METTLSPRQVAIFEFVKSYAARQGYAPSIRDIQDGCDLPTTSTVDYNLRVLERRGYIARAREQARSIRVLHLEAANGRCPLCGCDGSCRS